MKAVIVAGVLLCLLIGLFVVDDIAMERITEQMAQQLDLVREAVEQQGDVPAALTATDEAWDKASEWLLVMANHRDVDNVSRCILTMRTHLYYHQDKAALLELETAKFLLRDIPKKEKLTLVNIF